MLANRATAMLVAQRVAAGALILLAACTPGVTPEGYRVKAGHEYPPARDFGSDGDRGEIPDRIHDWFADNVGNPRSFDWNDPFRFSEWEGTGVGPNTADHDGDGEPDCTGILLILASNDSPLPTCDPYPVAAARASCDSMYKLAAMSCRKLCEESVECPLADVYVPAVWEKWSCFTSLNPPIGPNMQCDGIVECTCKPRT